MSVARMPRAPSVIVVMGVAGAGKTALGRALAASVGFRFEDADTHHPEANVRKMAAGVPLDDDDRAPWLACLSELISRAIADGAGLVLACSALKAKYRAALGVELPEVRLVHLTAPREVLAHRLQNRAGHFMPASLLDSQLDTLEAPADALTLDSTQPVADLVRDARAALF
jgi:gluconokinase